MLVRSSAGGGLTAVLLCALLTAFLPASARASVPRAAAAEAALKALHVSGDTHAVRVFGTLRTVAARTPITQSAPAGRATADRRTGVETATPAAVLTTPGEPVWLFYADRGPHQGFEHSGRVALVGARSGKVRLSGTLAWVPLIAGQLPEFFRSAGGYEGSRYVVFDRPWPGGESASAAAPPAAAATETQRRAAAALAAQHACVLRFSDTLGDFFDFGRVDQTRAQLGRFFTRLSALDPGFVTERYLPRLGRTPAAEAQRLIDRAGCRDLTLYAAGGAARGGSGGVVIGLRTRGGRVQWQTLSAGAIRALVRANPRVSFKLVFDAPYTGRLAAALRGEPNVAVLLASGGADEPSFAYLPALTGPNGLVANPGNPQHLLEFSNGLIDGLGRFAATPAEVDQGIAQTSTSFMAWMLARAVNLAGSPFAGHLISPVEIVPGTTAPAPPVLPGVPALPASPRPNHKPAGDGAAQATDEDTSVAFTLGGTDEDGDPLTFAVTAAPAHGTLSGTGPRVTYTPARDYAGADQLSFRVNDGTEDGDPVTVPITVRPVNDAPVVTPGAGRATYTEQAAPVAVAPGLVLADVDSPILQSARVAIDPGADELAFTGGHGITGAWDAAAGVLTLTGAATVADYQAALRSVTFSTPGDDPSTAVRTVRFRAGDGQASGDATRELAVAAVDDPPVLATTATGDAHYTENGSPVAIEPGLTVGDPDSADLTGATVSITANLRGADVLRFSDQGAIAGAYAGGVLTLSGTASPAAYQAALRSVAFEAAGEDPGAAARTISFTASDGSSSAPVTRDVAVHPVNDAPAVHTTGGSTAYPERGTPVAIDFALTVDDPDSASLTGATATIKAGSQAGDELSFAPPPPGITGAVNGDTVTFTGSAPVASYESALRGVRFASSNADPSASRTIAFSATDGADASAEATKAIAVGAINDAPVLTTSAGTTGFTENGDATAVDTGVTVTDADSTSLKSARVAISGNFHSGQDVLSFASTATITGAYDGDTGVLTLTGPDSVASYQAALRSVKYRNTSDDPDTGARTIAFSAADGTDTGAAATKAVGVTAVNDAPAVATTAGAAQFTEDQATDTFVDAAVTLSDPDGTALSGATVEITGGYAAGQDLLQFGGGGAISGSFSAGTLTLTGSDTLAHYEAALRSVKYVNASQAPSTATRTVTFTVTDGPGASGTGARNVQVAAVNDAPVLGAPGGATFTENATATPAAADAVAVAPDLVASDADSPNLTGATVQITGNRHSGEDVLAFADTATIKGAFDAASGTLTLTGADSVASYQDALRAVRYRDTVNAPDTGARTIRFVADDGQGSDHASAPVDRTVAVVAVNDDPAATDKTFNGAERAVGNTTLRVSTGAPPTVDGPSKDVSGNLLTGVTDPDGPGPLAVIAAAGRPTTHGGTVDLEADGDFAYHPKAGYSGSDTFGYSVSDQGGGTDSRTVTIDVQGVVWYVKAGAAAGDGRSDHPFASPGEAAAPSAAGQKLFLYPGAYAGGLALKDNQQLLSKRHGLVVSDGGTGSVTLEPGAPGGAGTEIAGGVVLASGNTLQGIDFGSTTGYALSGSSVGTAAIDSATSGRIANPAGGAVSITGTGNTLTAQLTEVSSSGSAGSAIAIGNASGSFSAQRGTLANASGADVALAGGSLSFTLGATISDASGKLVDVSGQTGGTKDFNGPLSGGAVRLTGNNAATTVRFDGGLSLSTGASDAFTATGGGTVAVTGSGNVIDSTTGRALNVNGTAIGSDGLTFRRISVNGAPQGIVLSGTGGGGKLTVTGSGGTCTNADQSGCSGGEIRNATGADDASATPVGTGIVLLDTAAPSFTRMYLHDFSNYAIRGTDVSGFTLASSVVKGTNGTTVASPYQDGSVRFTNLTGSASIAQSFIGGGAYDNLRVKNSTGTLNRLTVQGSEIGANGSLGNDGINVESDLGSGATMNVTVDQTAFTSAAGDLFQATIDGNGGGDVKFTGNTLSNGHPAIASGGVTLEGGRGGDTTIDVSGNTATGARGPALQVIKGQGNATLSGSIAGNAIGAAASADSGSRESNGVELDQNGGGLLAITLASNAIRQYNGDGIHLQAGAGVADAGRMNVVVNGNTLANPGANPAIGTAHQGLSLVSGVTPGDNFDVCLDLGQNSITGSGTHGGQDFRLRQRQSTGVRLISSTGGYTGGRYDTDGTFAVSPFVQSELGGAPTGTASTDPAGEGFAGGTTCP